MRIEGMTRETIKIVMFSRQGRGRDRGTCILKEIQIQPSLVQFIYRQK